MVSGDMEKEAAKHILFLMPLVYRPYLPNFSGRFDLPSRFTAHVIAETSLEFDGSTVGNAILRSVPIPKPSTRFATIRRVLRTVSIGLEIHRKRQVHVIYVYDPLTLGLCGAILKWITGARLVTEINGHLLTAGFLEKQTLSGWLKKKAYQAVIALSLQNSNHVKLLNHKMVEEFGAFIPRGRYSIFSDFVPTECFKPVGEDQKFIFFVGHPFYLKGVDLLIKAFKRLSPEFPDYRLKIMGFNNTDPDVYTTLAGDCKAIEFLKPVFYEEIIPLFQNCSFFVLPSRSEAMGRVLIEAMAAGKAVVASRVGGIPEVVEEGRTGLIFTSGNVDELEQGMRVLLEQPETRCDMGKAGFERMTKLFSTAKYMENFTGLLDRV